MGPISSVVGVRRLSRGTLTIEVGPERETCLVRLGGELDLDATPLLESELQRLLSTKLSAVIVDLGSLEFIDSTGLQCLVVAARRSQTNGNRLRFLPPNGDVERILDLSGLADALPISR